LGEAFLPGRSALDSVRGDWAALALLVAALLGGALLRLHALDAQSLWSDELSSWHQSHQVSLADVIERGVRPTPYPPGYPVLLYYVERFVGESEVALRLPSAIAGILAIAAMFALARQLYSRREAVIAATLLAFSYQPIYYSQEARAYSLLLLFSILSSHFWFRVQTRLEAEEPVPHATQVAYVACASGALYVHHFGLLLVGVQIGALCVLHAARPRALAQLCVLGLAVVATYLPWARFLIEDFHTATHYIPAPGWHSLADYWRFLFFDTSGTLGWFVAALFVIAALRALAARDGRGTANLRKRLVSPTSLLILWLVVPFALAYVRSATSVPILNNRNLIISLPPALILLARALTYLLPRVRVQALAVAGTVGLLIYVPFVRGAYYRIPRKEQFREAAAAVAARQAQTRDADVIAYAWNSEAFDYYLERTGAPNRVDLLAGSLGDLERTRVFLDAGHTEYVWYLVGHRRPDRAYIEYLDRNLELVEHTPLHGAFARLYRRPTPRRRRRRDGPPFRARATQATRRVG
jgi:mannosyltransferase